METLTTAERRSLRAKAHHLHPVVAIGAHGLTSTVMHEIDIALKAHELIKIRVWSDVRGERDAFLEEICRVLDCAPVQHLGKLVIVWRRNPDRDAKPATEAPSRRQTSVKRRLTDTPNERRKGQPSRDRVAAPSGSPRAPSRRRRGESATPPGRDPFGNDQSRRRRRLH